MERVMKRFFLCLFLGICVSLPAMADSKLRVVASFSILADMAKNIGGEDVEVTSLVGPDGDAHVFQPTPLDIKTLSKADLILMNGLGFEGWMDRLIGASGTKAAAVVASTGVSPRLTREDGKQITDPHAWQDLSNGRIYVKNIAEALTRALPHKAKNIRKRADDYTAQMMRLDIDTRAKFDAFPRERRIIITSHDAFGYFGDAYGVTFFAPLGINEEADPSAYDIARLIKQIKQNGIKTVFIENMTNPKMLKQIGKEANATVGGTLYSDALSPPEGDAPTYLALFGNNASKFVDALAKMNLQK